MNEIILHECEVTGALTDLLMGVIMIPLIIIMLLRKTDKKLIQKFYISFFFVLTAACFLGYIAHYYLTDGWSNIFIWSILLPVLYEVFACFFLVSLALFSSGKIPNKKHVLLVCTLILVPFAASFILAPPYNDTYIRILISFGGVLALTGFGLIVKTALQAGRTGEKIMLSSLLLFLPAAYFQIDRSTVIHFIFWFNCNGITHILTILGTIILFLGMMRSIKAKAI